MNAVCLTNKTCTPCQGGVLPLDSKKADNLFKQLDRNWQINTVGHLYNQYTFHNFIEAFNFANKVAIIAEQEAHHPNLIISWGKCEVEIWTHKINGLTENDFILAAKIDNIR